MTIKSYKSSDKREFEGMPSIEDFLKMASPAENIPERLLYFPVILRWILLGLRYRSLTLPSISNPMIETGGFAGESKSSVMDQVGNAQRSWLAQYVYFQIDNKDSQSELRKAIALLKGNGLTFPIVVKPDIGSNGYGVNLLEDESHLLNYMKAFPRGAKLLLQKPVSHDGEAGIFYMRYPGENSGHIYSFTLRYFPFVRGDGKLTLGQLIQNDPRSRLREKFNKGKRHVHDFYSRQDLEQIPSAGELIRLSFTGSLRTGGLYRDVSYLITPEMTQRFDEIARSMPEFYYGRFDIKFESIDLLRAGEGFSIIEINGAGAEVIHIWDPNVSLMKHYNEYFKAQSHLFRISALNRTRGFRPTTIIKFIKAIHRHKRLIKYYPPSG